MGFLKDTAISPILVSNAMRARCRSSRSLTAYVSSAGTEGSRVHSDVSFSKVSVRLSLKNSFK